MATHKQIPLDLGIEIQKDINGIEMGVQQPDNDDEFDGDAA